MSEAAMDRKAGRSPVSTVDVLSLARSYAQGGGGSFCRDLNRIATRVRNAGHLEFADDLEKIVADLRRRSAAALDKMQGMLASREVSRGLDGLVLAEGVKSSLQRLLREHREEEKLKQRGLSARRKVLFIGPPGVGKTASAAALAHELNLPFRVVLLDGLITKFMGETSAQLRLVFDAMTEHEGVYLFDEVDAIAADRGRKNDVGEARRVANSILQMMEEHQSCSVMVAATNCPELIDSAAFRRFDASVRFGLPGPAECVAVAQAVLLRFDTKGVDWSAVAALVEGFSHADIEAASLDAARAAVLDNDAILTTALVVEAVEARRVEKAPLDIERAQVKSPRIVPAAEQSA